MYVLFVALIYFSLDTMQSQLYPIQFLEQYFTSKYIFITEWQFCKNIGRSNYEPIMYQFRNKTVYFKLKKDVAILLEQSRVGVFVDIDCPENLNFLNQIPLNTMFNRSYAWVLWSQNKLTLELETLNLTIDSDVKLIQNSQLFDLYKVRSTEPLQKKSMGFLNDLKTFKQHETRNNLMNITLNGGLVLSVLPVENATIKEQISNTSYFSGFDNLNRLNIRLTNTWGYKKLDGLFMDGLMGMLQHNIVEQTLSPLLQSHERMNAARFLTPSHTFRMCFVFRQPQSLGTYKALALPFEPDVWLWVFGGLLIISMCCYLYAKSCQHDPSIRSVGGSLFVSFVTISLEGAPFTYNHVSGKLIILIALFYSILISTYYNAAIMNALLSPASSTVKTVNQLLRKLEAGVIDLPYTRSKKIAIIFMSQQVYDHFERNKNKSTTFLSLNQGVELVRVGGYAFYAEDTESYAEIEKTFSDIEKCDLSEIDAAPKLYGTPAVRKNSPFAKLFLIGLLKIREHGIMNRESQVWYSQKPTCLGSTNIWYVSLEAVTIALAALVFGIIFSVLLLIVEKYANKRRILFV